MTVILDYGLGNLASILNMHRRLGIDAEITNDPEKIHQASRLILPGVGHFKKGIENLVSAGIKDILEEVVLIKKTPILGICLGAQLMTRHSEEGDIEGLGWINADTVRFNQSSFPDLKVPHMGWADVKILKDNQLWVNMPVDARFYHVHSYHFKFDDLSFVSAVARHGYEFPNAFNKNNIFGVQFHPEKSHRFGMKILENFSNLSK